MIVRQIAVEGMELLDIVRPLYVGESMMRGLVVRRLLDNLRAVAKLK